MINAYDFQPDRQQVNDPNISNFRCKSYQRSQVRQILHHSEFSFLSSQCRIIHPLFLPTLHPSIHSQLPNFDIFQITLMASQKIKSETDQPCEDLAEEPSLGSHCNVQNCYQMEQYAAFFNLQQKFQVEVEEAKKLLLQSGQVKWDQEWKQKLSWEVLNTDFESMTIRLHLGHLVTSVQVIHIGLNFDAEFAEEQILGTGGFSEIYRFYHSHQNGSLKVIGGLKEAIPQDLLEKVYSQFLATRVASILKIGPKLLRLFLYDIVIVRNKAFFCLEVCEHRDQKGRNNFSIFQKNLKDNLKILHALNICHCDLKPQNIMWSSFSEKYVFIDFGLARFLKDHIQPSLTHFIGTYHYSSPEMKKLFIFNTVGYINLYMNDVYGLRLSLGAVEEENKQKHRTEDRVQDLSEYQEQQNTLMLNNNLKKHNFLVYFRRFMDIKYAVYTQNLEQVNKKMRGEREILKTIFQLIKSKRVENLFRFNLETISQIRHNLTQQLYKKTETSQLDEKLAKHEQTISLTGIDAEFHTGHLLKLQPRQFCLLVNQSNCVIRLFKLLDPIYCLEQGTEVSPADKVLLIQKIFDALKPGHQSEIYLRKVRAVCLFFYRNLKINNKQKCLQSLLLLMRSICDYQTIAEIEQRLIQIYEDEQVKQTKKLRFFLEWQCVLCSCVPSTKVQYLASILSSEVLDNSRIDLLKEVAALILRIIQRYQDNQFFYSSFGKIFAITNELEKSSSLTLDILFIKLRLKDIFHMRIFNESCNYVGYRDLTLNKHYIKKQKEVIIKLRSQVVVTIDKNVFPSIYYYLDQVFIQGKSDEISQALRLYFEFQRDRNILLSAFLRQILRTKVDPDQAAHLSQATLKQIL